MFSFRQKIFISYVVLYILFIFATFPLVTHIVSSIVAKAMEDRADELIAKIQSAPNNAALVRRLKEQKSLIFFRVSIISNEGKILYDSHTKQLMGPRFSQEYVIDHPEVLEAFNKGIGYSEDYSELLQQKFSYFAKTFEFHGKDFVIRMSFPNQYFSELTRDFKLAMIVLLSSILLLFSLITWFIINNLSSPIQQIINAVAPYQEGKQTTIPEIKLSSASAKGSFSQLAMTLNSMSNKIQKHIDSLTEERNEKEAILESLIEGVVAVDNKMKVTYSNSMAQKFIGNDPTGQNFTTLHEPKSYALLNSCQHEKRPLTDSLTLAKDNTKIYLDIVAAPKGNNSGAILVMQDKSTQYKLLEMRKDFIANASHELKTPITIIRGFAEILHDNPGLPLKTTSEMTQKIVSNCHRMTTLIKDLLTLSDIENIPLSRLEECDLYEMTEHCSSVVHDVYPDAQITIHHQDDHMMVVADPSLMELAITNLLENAAKYSTPPATIDVALKKESGKIIIEIADQGIGIPKHDQEHIFDRFYTVDKAHSQKMGGSGLGLSIVQNIIHKHFGTISLESELGKGTTFTITLPESSL